MACISPLNSLRSTFAWTATSRSSPRFTCRFPAQAATVKIPTQSRWTKCHGSKPLVYLLGSLAMVLVRVLAIHVNQPVESRGQGAQCSCPDAEVGLAGMQEKKDGGGDRNTTQ